MFQIAHVEKWVAGREVLAGSTLEIGPAETVALVGPNGSGKSTLLRIAAGVVKPDRGDVRLDGASVYADTRVRRRIGYVPESARPFAELTVAEMLTAVAAMKMAPPPGDQVVAVLGVDRFLGQRIGTLSLGQARRAMTVAALIGAPEVLILDEPSNGLDHAGVETLATLLREHHAAGRSALMATHDASLAHLVADRCVTLAQGRLVPAAVRASGRGGR